MLRKCRVVKGRRIVLGILFSGSVTKNYLVTMRLAGWKNTGCTKLYV